MATGEAQDAPLVSVIMPCFNAGAMLRPALASVIGQTHPNLEIIFVDNNSTDGSLATARQIAANQSRRVEIVTCAQQGVNHARNLGYSLARGAFIQWMDADDEIAPDKIALQVAAMQADATIDIAYGDWAECRMRAGRAPEFRPHRLVQIDDQVARTLAGVWWPPHLYLVRHPAAERLQAAEAWWPGRPVATDIEYSAVAALLGLRFRHVPEAKVRYNLWSPTQMGTAIAYGRRAAALGEIYQRLRALDVSLGTVRQGRHRTLLDLTWDCWRMPAGSVTIPAVAGRQVLARHVASGRDLELAPREAAAVTMLMAAPRPLATCHLALALVASIPAFQGDHAQAVQFLVRLQAEGFVVRVDLAALGPA